MAKKQSKQPPPRRCKICQISGHGPLLASQDGIGWVHAYGCQSNTTLKADSNSTIPLNYHRGKMCIVDFSTRCQEDYCADCMIYINRTEGIT